MATAPAVQEHRVVMLICDLGIGVADVLQEDQLAARTQDPCDLDEREVGVGVGDRTQGEGDTAVSMESSGRAAHRRAQNDRVTARSDV
jgi:hypothetical protein